MAKESAPRGNRETRRALMMLTAMGAVSIVALGGAAVWAVQANQEAEVPQGSFLHVRLEGGLPTTPNAGGPIFDPADRPLLATDIAWGIREAATDERIEGLYLDLMDPSMGFATVQEIRSAVTAFGETGKPCVAFAETYDFMDYYLASACKRVVLAPAGIALVTGMNAELTYYAGTLEKIGAVAQFEHVGDFKSAVEPLERSGPSEAASMAFDAMFDSLFGQAVSGMAAGRGIDVGVVRERIDAPALSARGALDQGWVDALAWRDQVERSLGAAGDDDFAERVMASQPAPTDSDEGEEEEADTVARVKKTKIKSYVDDLRDARSGGPSVAVVYAAGPIVSGESEGGLFGNSVLADRDFAGWMRQVRRDDDIAAVVLRVDSPGGSGLASDMMWREIALVQAAGKPVVVSMGDYAASGGYYIAAPADWIVAQPGTLTGSIGVFGGKLNLGGTWEKLGMTRHAYQRGAVADLFSTGASFSEPGRVAFRTFLQDFYDLFLDRVGEGRKLDRAAVHELAQGRVWTGEQALERKLVDELGGLDVAIAKAAELGGLGSDHGVRDLPVPKTFFEALAEEFDVANVQVDVGLPKVGVEVLRDVALMERILADGAAALIPARVDWR